MWPFRRRLPPPLGPRGEKLALRFLKRRGLKLLARNYRCPAGEADLILLDVSTRRESGAETIAFVEVKTRSSARHTDPQAAVDTEKRRRLRKVAKCYLAERRAEDFNVRFDIVAIIARDGKTPQIEYIPQAF